MSAPLPVPEPIWGRFSADPRQHPGFRAADADRDIAADAVNAAFAQGRLDAAEHAERLQAVLAAKRLGELEPLLADITVATGGHARPLQPAPAPGAASPRQAVWRSWIAVTVIVNVVWLMTWVLSASGPYYYWPMWPMLGMGIPVLMMYLFPDGQGGRGGKGRGQLGR